MATEVKPGQVQRAITDKGARAAFLEQIMGDVLAVVLPHAQARTPVLTGATRESEAYRVERGGLRGYLTAGTIYSPFVHARVPFFDLGIRDAQVEIRSILQESGDQYLASMIE